MGILIASMIGDTISMTSSRSVQMISAVIKRFARGLSVTVIVGYYIRTRLQVSGAGPSCLGEDQ
jgi:hypothetical protein